MVPAGYQSEMYCTSFYKQVKAVGLGHSQSDRPLAWGPAYFASAQGLYNRLAVLGYGLIQN